MKIKDAKNENNSSPLTESLLYHKQAWSFKKFWFLLKVFNKRPYQVSSEEIWCFELNPYREIYSSSVALLYRS